MTNIKVSANFLSTFSVPNFVCPSFRVRLTVRETRVVRKVPVGTARGIRKSTVRSDSVNLLCPRNGDCCLVSFVSHV